ncbi:hypothetical protein GYMLUDRAFT_100149 [Collybiopsis luxurians FD-317 M1]|uniref:AB hydrolase-1 domain-containing protein n=1 Tax=Collybiopsis luxurians FD-317 M1 TaxID=944289 RepID=A0A0D0BHH4_9AGAR|nr:hypothetical protein GYMLUDRAFT_100149 [Collybiopsis luxurians FD-317 M1]
MPFVEVSTSTGNIKFHYTISTPTCSDAESIDAGLPVLLFIHALAFHNVFHSQFGDPLLRKFNLVTFDLRYHGETTCNTLPNEYGAEEAADEVLALIDALQLPPCHFIAMDIGSMIAMQIAVTKPEKALSILLMSHLCLEELPEVLQVRTELNNLWCSYHPDAQIEVALPGYSQFTFGSELSNLAQAVTDYCGFFNFKNWDSNHSTEYTLTTYKFVIQRKGYSQEALSRISCPVKLLHGGNDLAYPEEYTRELVKNLEQAGVKVSWVTIPNAPHYICLDYGPQVNCEIYDFVMNTMNKASISATPTNVISPWDKILREYGWNPEGLNELDDDDIMVSYPSGAYAQPVNVLQALL